MSQQEKEQDQPEVEETVTEQPPTPPAGEIEPTSSAGREVRWLGPVRLEASEGVPAWIPIHRLCNRQHPQYGPIVMTEAKMDLAIANFSNRVHRPESPSHLQVPVDTRHAGDAACGWVVEMKKALPYLMARVDWTQRGQRVVSDKEFLYVSPAYLDDPEQGPIFKEITLTNRDFLKMPPIALDEGVWPDLSPLVPPTLESNSQEANPTTDNRRSIMANPTNEEATTQAALTEAGSDDLIKQLTTELEALKGTVQTQQTKLSAYEAQLAASEEATKKAEVIAACERAVNRGVAPYIVETMRTVLLSLSRKEDNYEIKLQSDGKDKAFPSLYAALTQFLAEVPAAVSLNEKTVSTHTPLAASTETDVDLEEVRRLVQAAGGELKKEE